MSVLGTGRRAPADVQAGTSAEAEVLIAEARARARRRRQRIALVVVGVAALGAGGLVALNAAAGSRPTAAGHARSAGTVVLPSGSPPYLVDATYYYGAYGSPQVRDSATGRLVASVPVGRVPGGAGDNPPYGLAATGPGSFVLGMMTSNDCATQLYRFRLDAGGQPGALTPVGPALPGDLTSIAASAGGALIGYAINGDGCADGYGGKVAGSYLGVLNARTGQTRQWTDPSPYPKDQPWGVGQLSMSANGALLAFSQQTERPFHGQFVLAGAQVRVLSTSAAAGTVAERSRVAARIPLTDSLFSTPTVLLSPSGSAFYLCTQPFSLSRRSTSKITETARISAYQTATGKATGLIAAFSASYSAKSVGDGGIAPLTLGCSTMALDPSGRFLLVPYLQTVSNTKIAYSGGSLTVTRINTATRARSTWTLRFGERESPGTMTVAW